ncbi:hypothetical protein C8Q78DRAFT_960768 [Trametes maxima]|nr:hypothetical protein C8Q78DRAFT_960768 [Trametes maxima]
MSRCRHNLDREETAEGLGGPLGYFFFKRDLDHVLGGHRWLLNSLRTPCMPKQATRWLSEGKMVIQRSALLKLPPEALDQIFEELQGHDIFMLGIACKYLLCVAEKHILATLKELHAPWQDCRLILLGDTTRGRAALPRGLLSDAEREAIGTDREGGLAAYAEQKYIPALGERDALYHLRRTSSKKLRDEMRNAPWQIRNARGLSDYRMFCVLWGCTGVEYPAGPLVLCNLTKGEYVCEEKLMSRRHFDMSLAHALLVRVAWSSDPSVSMRCSDEFARELTRGVWAGDRFEVATMETLPKLTYENRRWRDVSSSVDKLLMHLCKENIEI